MIIDKNFWTGIAQGRITPRDAIAALVAVQHTSAEARELVFIALGGSDLVETGPDGVDRYPSGKTVDEVEKLLNSL